MTPVSGQKQGRTSYGCTYVYCLVVPAVLTRAPLPTTTTKKDTSQQPRALVSPLSN